MPRERRGSAKMDAFSQILREKKSRPALTGAIMRLFAEVSNEAAGLESRCGVFRIAMRYD